MKNNAYTALAEFYDALNAEVDYDSWAAFLRSAIEKYEKRPTELVLDLCCGTGALTVRLAKYGYSMIGVDGSQDMLGVAAEAGRREKTDILWLCQDMRGFELYGTVGAAVCCLDSINYLTRTADILKTFSLVHNYLDPDGIFIFDINTPYKFKNVYADRSYVLEAPGAFCVWQNDYRAKSGICGFKLDIFEENSDGSYLRREEYQRERCYAPRTVLQLLKNAGFELISCCSDFSGKPLSDTDERAFFIARAIK